MLSRRHYPPGTQHLISEGRLRDWLRLLNYSVHDAAWYYFQPPFGAPLVSADDAENRRWAAPEIWRDGWRRLRTWPPFAGCYMLVARKQMYTVTPLRAPRRLRPRLVGQLVNPTTRNAA